MIFLCGIPSGAEETFEESQGRTSLIKLLGRTRPRIIGPAAHNSDQQRLSLFLSLFNKSYHFLKFLLFPIAKCRRA